MFNVKFIQHYISFNLTSTFFKLDYFEILWSKGHFMTFRALKVGQVPSAHVWDDFILKSKERIENFHKFMSEKIVLLGPFVGEILG